MSKDINLKEILELKFYEDDELDLTLLELINKDSFKRGREFFIKEILRKYFIELDKDNFNKIKEKYKKNIDTQKLFSKSIFD
jgi:hypothetical protein